MNDQERGFDAFASYAYDPDYRTVRAVERFLESLHARPGLRAAKLPPLRICVDGSDFAKIDRAAPGAIAEMLERYVAGSSRLLLFCSRGAATSPWVDQELAYFLEHHSAADVLCVVTEGVDPGQAPEEVFSPRMIAAGLHCLPWYDVRALRRRAAKQWHKVRDAEDEMVRLGAHLWNATAGMIYPSWQRARLRRRRLSIAVSAATAAAAMAALASFAYVNSDSYALKQLASSRSAKENTDKRAISDVESAKREIATTTDPDGRARAELRIADAERKTNVAEARRYYLHVLSSASLMFGEEKTKDLIVNSITAGVDRTAISAFIHRLGGRLDLDEVGDSAIDLASNGRIDDAVFVARTARCTKALASIPRLMPDRAAAYALLVEAEKLLSEPPVENQIVGEPYPGRAVIGGSRQDIAAELVTSYLAIDQPERALQVAKRYQANLAGVSEYYLAKGDFQRAAEVVHGVQAVGDDDPAESVAKTLIYAGRFGEARQWIAATIPAGWEKLNLLAHAASDAVKAGKLDEARRTLEQTTALPVSRSAVDPVTDLAQSWAAVNEPQKAAQLLRAEWRTVPKNDTDDLQRIIGTYAEIGLPDDALALLPEFRSDRARSEARRVIVNALIARQEPDRALAAAGTDGNFQQMAYGAMIKKLASAGDSAAVISLLPKVESTARDDFASDAMTRLIDRGDVAGAARVAALLSDKYDVQSSFAVAWAKKNDPARAAAAVEKIKHPDLRACAAADAAEELHKRNAPPDVVRAFAARAVAAAPRDNDNRSTRGTLQCITSSLLAIGEMDAAVKVTRTATSDSTRDELLSSIVEQLAKRGAYKRARDLTDEIRSSVQRNKAIDAILAAANHGHSVAGAR